MTSVQKTTFDVPIGGKIVAIDGKKIRLLDDDGKEAWVSSEQVIKHMHNTSIKGVEDMIILGDLQEYAILRNLHMRYMKKLIYVSGIIMVFHTYDKTNLKNIFIRFNNIFVLKTQLK